MTGKMDSVSIRLPYRNLKQAEVEMAGVNGDGENVEGEVEHRIELDADSSAKFSDVLDSPDLPTSSHPPFSPPLQQQTDCSLVVLVLSCMVAAGVQFGWALQLSLLTPYVQTLGIGHAFSSFIWLCGPITGLVVQPCVGIWSDKCTSKYGRRRPFIFAGSLMISMAVIIIGFAADIGYLLGDTKEHCSTFKGTRTRAAFVFIIGFWMLDLANNTVQGPARALLADLSGPDQRNSANAIFCSWMAVGNILGFSAGSTGEWHRWFPFLTSRACCEACGNLKAAFLIAVVFLTFCTLVTMYFAREVPHTEIQHHRLSDADSAPLLDDPHQAVSENSRTKRHSLNGGHGNVFTIKKDQETDNSTANHHPSVDEDQSNVYHDGPGAVLVNLLTTVRHLPPAMHPVLIVMALSWLSWFPFFLFDTDWMGREVYHGDPSGNADEVKAYDHGVREGAFGLLLNSVVLGVSSFLIEPMCRQLGARLVWAISNFTVFICMAVTAIISMISVREYTEGIQDVIDGSGSIRIASLIVFALLGFPLAITYSVPFSVTAELTADSGGGQGLAIGVLNLAIVVPQIIVSLGAGPWDALFGGGNIPAFVLASFAALAAGIVAVMKLPTLASNSFKSTGFHFG